jgi:type VI protein secretion system component VasK
VRYLVLFILIWAAVVAVIMDIVIGSDTAWYAAQGLMVLVTVVFCVIVSRDIRRIRARREARQRGSAGR